MGIDREPTIHTKERAFVQSQHNKQMFLLQYCSWQEQSYNIVTLYVV